MSRKTNEIILPLSQRRAFHVFTDKPLTIDEWTSVRALPKEHRFRRGDEIEEGKFFVAYHKKFKNGLMVTSKIALAKIVDRNKADYRNNREKRVAQHAVYYRKNRKACNDRAKEYAENNREKLREIKNRWVKNNPEKVKIIRKKDREQRYADPQKHIALKIRGRLKCAFKHRLLYGRAVDKESVNFLLWLARHQSLDLRQEYEIDHLVPVSKCDLSTVAGQIKANAPENVRWLTKEQNLCKKDRLPSQEEIESHLLLVKCWRKEKEIQL